MRAVTLNQGPLFDNGIFHEAELCLLMGRRIRETAPPTPKDQKEENIKMRSKPIVCRAEPERLRRFRIVVRLAELSQFPLSD